MKESKLPKYNENNIVKDDKNIIYRIKNQLILDGLNSIKSVDTTLDEICIGTILSEEDNNENMNLLPDAVSHMIKNIRITINGWYADISVFWMDKDISERLNKKERQEDKDLLKRFNDIQSNLIEEAKHPENDEPRILIETNVK